MGTIEQLEKLGVAEVLRGMARGLHGQPGSQVRSEVEAWLRLKEFERTQAKPISVNESEIPLVFISYDTRDIELVHYIDSILKRVFQEGIRTFIAQRDIKAGEAAFQRMLQDSIAKSRLVLALCTKRSLTSPWLWFESGAGFGRGDFIPMLSGVTPEEIKPPMNIFQSKSLDNKLHIEQLLSRVAEITGIKTDTTVTDDEFNALIEICLKLDALSTNNDSTKVADAINCPLKPEITFDKVDINSNHHKYRLRVKLVNESMRPVLNWHLDVEMPTEFLDAHTTYAQRVPERSTRVETLFRSSEASHGGAIYPGDERIALTVDYHVNDAIYSRQNKWMDLPVTARVYVEGKMRAVSCLAQEIQCF